MPWWDDPEIGDEIDAMMRDLQTVDHVLAALPHGSPDWLLADRSSIDIGVRLRAAIGRAEHAGRAPGVAPAPGDLLKRAHGAMAQSSATRVVVSEAAASRARRGHRGSGRPAG